MRQPCNSLVTQMAAQLHHRSVTFFVSMKQVQDLAMSPLFEPLTRQIRSCMLFSRTSRTVLRVPTALERMLTGFSHTASAVAPTQFMLHLPMLEARDLVPTFIVKAGYVKPLLLNHLPRRWRQRRRASPPAAFRRTGTLRPARLVITLTCPPAAHSALTSLTTTTSAT